jgi:hypothetical protein
MGCNCGKRGKLIGAGIKAIKAGRPVAPVVRSIGRTVATDLRNIVRPANPRLGKIR